jgi:hypothetical protein
MEVVQGFLEQTVHRNGATPPPFCDALSEQDLIADGAVAAENHFPSQA